MSALHATPLARPARQPAAPAPARRQVAPPRLRVVQAPRPTRTRVPFVVACMALLAASLLGALVLNTSMAQGEYERFALQSSLARSAQQQQQLTEQLEHARSSPALAAAAEAMGMVPAGNGGYLRLSDGAVLGDPRPAEAGG